MLRAEKALLDINKVIPNKYAIIQEIRLFGSYASGNNRSTSDLDILVLTEETITDRVLRSKIREDIDDICFRYRLDTDVVFYSYKTYENDDSRFTNELKNSKRIYKRGD